MELQSRVEDIRRDGLGLAAISYGPPDVVAAFAKEFGISFPLLSDPGSETIRRYGLLNTVADAAMDPALGGDLSSDPTLEDDFARLVSVTQPSERFQGMAIPGTFILNPDGRVFERFFEDFYRERNTVASILLRLGREGGDAVQARRVSTKHLTVTTYASDAVVALGHRFALVFDVEPEPDMHVYAPGAARYQAISLTLDDQPFIRSLATKYPPSEIYHFEPLDERVPVYQSPFRLLHEVVPEATPEAVAAFQGRNTLTIAGTLDYQACDRRLCYTPVSIPLSWTIAIRPFARP